MEAQNLVCKHNLLGPMQSLLLPFCYDDALPREISYPLPTLPLKSEMKKNKCKIIKLFTGEETRSNIILYVLKRIGNV